MRINLGSGNNYITGYINIDKSRSVGADIIVDVEKTPLPFDYDTCEEILARDFFEHILYPIPVLNECWRVLKKDHSIFIEVPMAGTEDYYKDPTHVRPFVPETFKYFSDYADSYPAIGCKPWVIVTLDHTPNRIKVEMRPRK